jgi:Peroxiredoxin
MLKLFSEVTVFLININFNNYFMAQITFKNTPVNTSGYLPKRGEKAPDFKLVNTELATVSLHDFRGKKVVLNIFPSLDTGVCAASVRRFNKMASEMDNTAILAISKDLPFAHARFCTIEGIENVIPLSDFRISDFDDNYGVLMVDGPLKGLLARAVVLIDTSGEVLYSELVPEIAEEPNYEAVLSHLK